MRVIKLWEHVLSDNELLEAICATIRTLKPYAIKRSWARSYKSDRGYYYKRDKTFINVCCAFDIETTRDPATDTAYMYIWQMAINDTIILGTDWSEFFTLLDRIKAIIKPRKNERVIIWVHNLSYETQFIKRYIRFDAKDYFYTGEREPVYYIHDNFWMFKDSLKMVSGASLEKLAKDYTKTQKAKGDLNYEILRNKTDAKHMSDKEYGYCINDVLILSEYAAYFWSEYIIKHYNPVTFNSVLRQEMKDRMDDRDRDYIAGAYPELEVYQYLVSDIYRGGYVHGNACYMGELFTLDDHIGGADITSSYPAWMLQMTMPGKFVFYKDLCSMDEVLEIAKQKHVIMTCEFFNIRNTMPHSIESLNKCHNAGEMWADKKHSIIDNGRILRARHMIVSLTELDLYNYISFYTWSAVKITKVYVAEPTKLPLYVINPLLKYYKAKNQLKIEGKSYSIEKIKCNSFYGISVTRLSLVEYEITEGGDINKVPKFDFKRAAKSAFLLPQWGVYISTWARFRLLQMVATLEASGYHVLYCDTDSIKALDWDSGADAIIADYNAKNKERVKAALNYYNISEDHIVYDDPGKTIGDFDIEYRYLEKFKMQGAKRYCYTYKGKFNSTIAGLPKGALLKYYNYRKDIDHLTDPYSIFEDGLSVPDVKLGSIYYDEPTEAVINGELMQEQSSVCLTPTSFTMGLTEDFMALIDWLKQNEDKEYRR